MSIMTNGLPLRREIKVLLDAFLSNLSNGLWLSVRYVTISLLGFAVSIFFAREYSPESYGEFQLFVSSMALFSIFSLPGLNMLGMRIIASSGTDCIPQIVKVSFYTSLIAIPFLAIYGLYFLETQANIYWIAGLMALCFPLLYAPNSWYVYYEGRSLFRSSTIRLILLSFATNVLLIIGIFLKLSSTGLFTMYLFSNIFLSWIYYFQVRKESLRRFPLPFAPPIDWRYAILVSVQKYTMGLSEYLPIIVISFLLGVSFVAQFQIAFVFFSAVAGFVGALASLYLPSLFRNRESSHLAIFFQSLSIGVVVAIGYWFLVKYLFLFVYGSQYLDGLWLAKAFFVLPILASVRTFLVNFFTVRGKNGFLILVYIVANIISLSIFFLARDFTSPLVNIVTYVYSLFLTILFPLMISYLSIALKNTDSI